MNDQELFKQAKKEKKREEKEKKKEIQKMLKDPSFQGEDGHLNLFMTEEYESTEKEKLGGEKMAYLKRTTNLGEFFESDARPWYTNKNKKNSKYGEANKDSDGLISKKEAKSMLRYGKISLIIKLTTIARNNPMRSFGQVLKLEKQKSNSPPSSPRRHKKDKSHKSHKSHKKEKKEKKSKKSKRQELKDQKLREI